MPVGVGSHAFRHFPTQDPRIHGNTGAQIDPTEDSPPERHELFLLGDGEKKVEYEPETRTFHPTHELNYSSLC